MFADTGGHEKKKHGFFLGWDVGIESGPEGGGRPNRIRFQSGRPKTNEPSGPDQIANRATSFRPEQRPFQADPGRNQRDLRSSSGSIILHWYQLAA